MQILAKRLLTAAAMAAVVVACGEAIHPTGPQSSSGLKVSADAISSEGTGGPSITTDLPDYYPGDTVTITGTGWQPNEIVSLRLEETPAIHDPLLWNVAADSLGAFIDRTFEVQEHDFGTSFTLYATGAFAADTAQFSFTDANLTASTNIDTVTVSYTRYSTTNTCSGSSPGSGGPTPLTSGNTTLYSSIPNPGSVKIDALSHKSGLKFIDWSSGSTTLTDSLACLNDNGSWVAKLGYLTTTALSANPTGSQIVGTSITFTALVTRNFAPSTLGNGDGQLRLIDGGSCDAPADTLSGSLPLTAGGDVQFTTSGLAIGTHSIIACYAGKSAGFLLPSADTLEVIITSASVATATTVIGSPNPSVTGQSVTFTATVKTDPGNVAVNALGTVTFRLGGSDCTNGTVIGGPTTIDASGQATASRSFNATEDASTIRACYSGATGYDASSGTTTQNVNKAATSTDLTSDGTPSIAGASVLFTATVTATSPGSGTPTGSVSFYEFTGSETCALPGLATALSTGTLSSGVATFSTSSLAAGSHDITACYGGDSNYSSSQDAFTQVVNAIATTTTVTALPVDSAESGVSVTFTGAVKLASDNTTPVTVGTMSFHETSCAGTLLQAAASVDGTTGEKTFITSALSIGTHTIVACYEGATNYATSNGSLSYKITKIGTETSVSGSPNPSVTGESVTLTATVKKSSDHTTNIPSGSVTFRLGSTDCTDGTTIGSSAAVSAGTATVSTSFTHSQSVADIRACYAENATYRASEGTTTQTINKANTSLSLTLTVGSTPSTFGTNLRFTSEISVTSPGSGTPTGNVKFYQFGAGETCDAPGSATAMKTVALAAGLASMEVDSLNVGTHSITACYGGDANYNGDGSPTLTQVVDPAPTTLVLTVAPSTQQYSDTTVFTVDIDPYEVLTQQLTGKVFFYVGASLSCGSSAPSGAVDSVAIADADNGVDSLHYKIMQPAGSYTVTACFFSSNPSFGNSNDAKSLTVNAENATVFNLSSTPDPVQVGSGSNIVGGPIVLTLRVKERSPETNNPLALLGFGDVDSLSVNASGKGVLSSSNTLSFSCARDGATTGSGYSRYAPWKCTGSTSTIAADTYDVAIIVGKLTSPDRLYFVDTASTVIQVTDPSLGFATGGGWYADGDDRINFGFQAKATVNNRKTVYQGGLLVIRHKPNGDEIRVKSNVFDGYSISGNAVTFTGKATYSVNGVTLAGDNYPFTGYAQDNGTPGSGVDKFGLYYAKSPNAIATASTLSGLVTSAKTISGGNVQVPQPSKK